LKSITFSLREKVAESRMRKILQIYNFNHFF